VFSFLSVGSTLLILPTPRGQPPGFQFLDGLGHCDEFDSDLGEGLWSEETLSERDAASVADRALQISRPHVLDEKEACGAARAQRGGHVVYLAL
jgi:hypothetical protein